MTIFDQTFRALDRTARDARIDAALTECNALMLRTTTTLDRFDITAARLLDALDVLDGKLTSLEARVNRFIREGENAA